MKTHGSHIFVLNVVRLEDNYDMLARVLTKRGHYNVRTRMRIAFGTILLCTCVLIAGCEDSPIRNFISGKAGPDLAEKVPTSSVSPSQAEPAATDSPAIQTRFDDDAKVPEDFPKDVPLYANGKVVMTEETQDRKSFKVQIKTTDETANVRAYFERAIADFEWKLDLDSTDTKDVDLMSLGFTKDENRFLSVTLIKNVDGSGLNIVVSTGFRKSSV
jgi:hypothetical protein